MFQGLDLIKKERLRQIVEEGWDDQHDDEHRDCELAWAATCYACPRYLEDVVVPTGTGGSVVIPAWPWDDEADKRGKHHRVRQLVIAGALIAAEIDRLIRLGESDG